jgi:hypothetical protein
MPNIVDPVASMTIVQKLSSPCGQKYFSRTTTREDTTDRAIVEVELRRCLLESQSLVFRRNCRGEGCMRGRAQCPNVGVVSRSRLDCLLL